MRGRRRDVLLRLLRLYLFTSSECSARGRALKKNPVNPGRERHRRGIAPKSAPRLRTDYYRAAAYYPAAGDTIRGE